MKTDMKATAIMKLRYSPTSPFVRKVWIVAIERGLDAAIERIPVDFQVADPAFLAENPLRKVPTLVLDDGSALFDSPVICEYLDQLPGAPRLFPTDGESRWTALRLQALADGMADAAVAVRMEMLRPEAQRSQTWIDRHTAAVRRGLASLNGEASALSSELTIGTISVIATLGYIDFRMPDLEWRTRSPALAAWLDTQADRHSVRSTVPAA